MNKRQDHDFDEEIDQLGFQLRYRHHNDRNRYRDSGELSSHKHNRSKLKRNSREYAGF
ncbi:MAG: hypothetical protein PVG66_04380 [Chromatiales bacterium]